MNKDKILLSFFDANSLNELAKSVGEEFMCPIIITDCAFHIVCSYSYLNYDDPIYKTAVRHSELSFSSCSQIGKKAAENQDRFWICIGNNNVYVSSLVSANVLLGYVLYIFKERRCNLPEEKSFLFCESLLAKQFYIERHCCDSVSGTAQEILEDLLDGKFENEKLFNIQASGTYLSHLSPNRFAVIDFLKAGEHENPSDFVFDKINFYFHGAHPFFYRGKIIFFIHEDSDLQNLEVLANEFQLRLVVSMHINTLYDMRFHYITISDIFNISCFKASKSKIAYENDYLLLTKLINQKDSPIDLKTEKLLDYDIKNKSEFCLTLYNYLICSRSLKKTAQKMFTHPNTVLYRIQKAKNDFKIDTDNPDMHFYYLFSLASALLKLGNDSLFIRKSDFDE